MPPEGAVLKTERSKIVSSATYELIALAARYWFAGVALLIVIRAWRCTVQDNRRAKVLRDWTPETGCVGELIALTGSKKFKKGERFPVLRESVLGSGRNADIRILHPSIQKAHLHMELREGGMLARGMQNAEFSVPGQGKVRKLLLRDGMEFSVGSVRLMLVLYDAQTQENPDEFEAFEPRPESDSAPAAPRERDPEFEEFWPDDSSDLQ